MRQAITTRYRGPTDFQGARVVARCDAKRMTVPWDHALNPEQNHQRAAKLLAEKLEWHGDWCGGGTADGYAFVMVTAGSLWRASM